MKYGQNNLTIVKSVFNNHKAYYDGGILIYYHCLTFKNEGVIQIDDAGDILRIENCSISNSFAEGNGG